MSAIKVKCSCGATLKVNVKDNTKGSVSFKCPKCQKTLKATISDDETDIAVSSEKIFMVPPSLYVNEVEFPLKKGENIVGRKTTSDTSDKIGITPADAYMSRKHVVINVKAGLKGLECHLEAMQTPNPTKINGNIIEKGDVVIVKLGDRITMGHTEVLLESAGYFDGDHTMTD
ncbi:MAG: FHA domain-containing protein [Bacteroidaceae bacterium]|nr:FHA domain-containing protein [Bacteroidaceae bacterium]